MGRRRLQTRSKNRQKANRYDPNRPNWLAVHYPGLWMPDVKMSPSWARIFGETARELKRLQHAGL